MGLFAGPRCARPGCRNVAPELAPTGPLHPANVSPFRGEDWNAELAAVAGFDQPAVRSYEWSIDYSGGEFARLLATLSEIRLLEQHERDTLLAGVEHGDRRATAER